MGNDYGFADMTAVLEPRTVGVASVEHIEVTELQAKMSAWESPQFWTEAGKYCRLTVNGRLMMSDTNMERRSNIEFKRVAHGDVLIAGLGLGMILTGIMDKTEVQSVTVIEKYQDVIDAVEPQLRKAFNGTGGKLRTECADIFAWKAPQKYNVIYFDIWPDICTDNLKQIAKLHQRFKFSLNRKDPDYWMGSWMRDYLKSEQRRWGGAH